MKAYLLKLDEKNLNGRVYPTEAVMAAIKEVPASGLLGINGVPNGTVPGINLTEVSHMAKNLRIEDGNLVADIEVLKTPRGQELQWMMDNCDFRPNGYANIDKDGIVSNYSLHCVSAIPKGSGS